MLLAIMSSVFVRSIAELGPAINGIRFNGQEFTLSLLTLAPALGAIITGAILGRLASNDSLRLQVMLAAPPLRADDRRRGSALAATCPGSLPLYWPTVCWVSRIRR